MSKVRTFSRSKKRQVVPVEHPDGGRFHIRVPSYDDARRMLESVIEEEFLYDKNGSMVYNQKTGEPVRKARYNLDNLLTDAASFVERIDQLKDEDSGEDLVLVRGSDDALILEMLKMPGTKIVEVKVERDGIETVESQEMTQPVYEWVLDKVRELGEGRRKVAEKNCSTTPDGISAAPAESQATKSG